MPRLTLIAGDRLLVGDDPDRLFAELAAGRPVVVRQDWQHQLARNYLALKYRHLSAECIDALADAYIEIRTT